MKLRIRYENEYQTLELDPEATEQLWVSLSLEGDGLSQDEKETKIQQAWEEQFNRPDYNCWHTGTRHIDPTPNKKVMDGKRSYIKGTQADSDFNIMEYLLTISAEEAVEKHLDYEEVCDWVKAVLKDKPEWADAFISVRLKDENIREYADRIHANENSITKKLKRAEKKLKKVFEKRQI